MDKQHYRASLKVIQYQHIGKYYAKAKREWAKKHSNVDDGGGIIITISTKEKKRTEDFTKWAHVESSKFVPLLIPKNKTTKKLLAEFSF